MNLVEFESGLESLINRCSMENGSNTPDFMLVKYLMGCLHNYDSITKSRDNWYGVTLCPGNSHFNRYDDNALVK